MNTAEKAVDFVRTTDRDADSLVIVHTDGTCEIGLVSGGLAEIHSMVCSAVGVLTVALQEGGKLPDRIANDEDLYRDSVEGYLGRVAHGLAAIVVGLAPDAKVSDRGIEAMISLIRASARAQREVMGAQGKTEPAQDNIIPTTTIH